MVNAVAPPPKRYRKPELPLKICRVCGRPFSWRRKWSRVWDEVNTCSERCKGEWLRRSDP